MRASLFLFFIVFIFGNCSDTSLKKGIIGEWKLNSQITKCEENEDEIYTADTNGCVELNYFVESTGLTIISKQCAILVFEENRAFWKINDVVSSTSNDYSYFINDTSPLTTVSDPEGKDGCTVTHSFQK